MSRIIDELKRTDHKRYLGGLDFFKYIGPGLLVTVGFIDPGNWASNFAAGSEFGYALLWVVTLSTIMLIVLQHNVAHLGIVTGLCLSEAATQYCPKWISRPILGSAVLASISTSLAEILGGAIALQMLLEIPIAWGSVLTTMFVVIMLFSNSYKKIERAIIAFIGADIMMAFDECPPGDSDYAYAKKSLGLTHRWLDRCIQRFNETEPKYGYSQSLFPIVQGCVYPDLRKQSAEYIASKDADGNAIGGLAVGEPVDKMYEMIELVNEILPKDKPRYLMGVGTPVNILEGIERGVDMFDCVMPTRNGRNGMLFTKDGIMNMRNKKWEADFSPIEADGASYVDTLYSKAYLRHLFHAQELLAMQIASIHNLAFYLWLVGEARKHIIAGDFSTWKPMMVKRVSTRL